MYRILIVDDEAVEREGVKFLLNKLGFSFQIFTKANGRVALEFLKETKVDIICSDIKMPFMDGLALCEAAKELDPSVKIVMLTAYGDFEYTKRAIRVHVDDYIMKPVEVAEFKEIMDRIVKELDIRRAEQDRKKEMIRIYETAPRQQKAALLDSIILELQKQYQPQYAGEDVQRLSSHSAIQQVIDIIREEFATELTLDDLAERISLSKGYLSNLFKSETGVSLMQYVTMLRMQKAHQLLLTTNMKLRDIGEVVGYQNPSYFCMIFKKHYGVTAQSLRREENEEACDDELFEE